MAQWFEILIDFLIAAIERKVLFAGEQRRPVPGEDWWVGDQDSSSGEGWGGERQSWENVEGAAKHNQTCTGKNSAKKRAGFILWGELAEFGHMTTNSIQPINPNQLAVTPL